MLLKLDYLCRKNRTMFLKILILDVHRQKNFGNLKGSTPKEQYDYYEKKYLNNATYVKSLLQEYPELKRLLELKNNSIQRAECEIRKSLYAEKEQETKKAGMSEEDDFLKSFEADTDLEGDADTFIRQFEDELDQAPGEERTQKTTEENNQFFKDLDGILDSARDADESTGGAEAAETAHASEDGDLMVDTIGDSRTTIQI